ncbi:MAG: DUF4240 domain-containing protein [Jannaschia sp.]
MRASLALDRRSTLLGAAACVLPFQSLASNENAPIPTEDAFWQLIETAQERVTDHTGFLPRLYECTDEMSPTRMRACLEGVESVHSRIHMPRMRHAERVLCGRYDDDALLALTWGLIVAGRTFCDDAIRDPETMAGHVPLFLQANLAAALFDREATTIGYVVSEDLYPEMSSSECEWSDEQLHHHFPRLAAWAPTFRAILNARAMAVTINV